MSSAGQRTGSGSLAADALASCTNEEQQLYLNLCLLDVHSHGTKHGVELNRQSFRKPNPKALELVLYRLYASIAGENRAAKDFKNLWPVADKNQSKDFNQKISEWFKDLKDKYQLESVGSMTASQLRSATGHRVVVTLLELSSLALSLEYQRLAPEAAKGWGGLKVPAEKDPKLMAELGHALPSLAAVSVAMGAQEFAEHVRRGAAAQTHYEGLAKELVDQYYSLKSQLQQLEAMQTPHHAQVLADRVAALGSDPLGAISQAVTEAQCYMAGACGLPPLAPGPACERAMRHVASLEEHLRQYRELSHLMAQSVGSAVHPHAIDGAKLARAAEAAAAASAAAAEAGGVGGLGPGAGGAGSVTAAQGVTGAGAASARPVDIGGLLETWMEHIEACAPLVLSLAGQPHTGAEGATGGVSPLLAGPSDSTSHAALLATQLRVRRTALGDLSAVTAKLRAELEHTEAELARARESVTRSMPRNSQGPSLTTPMASYPAFSPGPKGLPGVTAHGAPASQQRQQPTASGASSMGQAPGHQHQGTASNRFGLPLFAAPTHSGSHSLASSLPAPYHGSPQVSVQSGGSLAPTGMGLGLGGGMGPWGGLPMHRRATTSDLPSATSNRHQPGAGSLFAAPGAGGLAPGLHSPSHEHPPMGLGTVSSKQQGMPGGAGGFFGPGAGTGGGAGGQLSSLLPGSAAGSRTAQPQPQPPPALALPKGLPAGGSLPGSAQPTPKSMRSTSSSLKLGAGAGAGSGAGPVGEVPLSPFDLLSMEVDSLMLDAGELDEHGNIPSRESREGKENLLGAAAAAAAVAARGSSQALGLQRGGSGKLGGGGVQQPGGGGGLPLGASRAIANTQAAGGGGPSADPMLMSIGRPGFSGAEGGEVSLQALGLGLTPATVTGNLVRKLSFAGDTAQSGLQPQL